jgi:hypothetical protein
MPAEVEVLNLLIRYQQAWFTHFPLLSRRAEWHIVKHLCMKRANGSPVGELYGLAKQFFLLDDATVRERLVSLDQMGLCDLDPPGHIYARSVATPSPDLLARFDAHLQTFAMAFSDTARAFGVKPAEPQATELSARHRALLLEPLQVYSEQWGGAVDRFFESGRLSQARRIDAKRHLISSSHWNLLHRAIRWHYEAEAAAAGSGGILADRLAAQLLQLTGQTIQTTRDHIAYLLEIGLFERAPGRALRVVVSKPAVSEIGPALGQTAERLPAILKSFFVNPAAEAHPVMPPVASEAGDGTVNIVPGAQKAAATEPHHLLEVLEPGGASRRIRVRPPLTIGRMAPSDLVLNGADISRTHCRILENGALVAVEDLRSTNGTLLNDQRIATVVPLKPGDRLQIGSYVLVYQPHIASARQDRIDETLRTRRAATRS